MRITKLLYYFISLLILSCFVSSCKKDEMTPQDTKIAFEIKEVPVTEDYLVGAMYLSLNDWSASNYEVPVIGKYGPGQPSSDSVAMEKHIEQAAANGIDFFLFDFSPSYDDSLKEVITDSNTFASIFLSRPNSNAMHFALKFQTGYLGISAKKRMHVNDTTFIKFVDGFKKMIPYFKSENYQKVGNKYLVYMSGASDIYSDSTLGNEPVYKELRAQMLNEGIDMYIVGEQGRWTPPARYELRLRNCVDAVTSREMILTTEYEASQFFNQYVYLNWEYSVKYFSGWGVGFVPQIQPAFTDLVENPSSGAYVFKSGDESFFRKYCNVAKANCNNPGRLIFIDSYNNWVKNTQVEPSVKYGNLYLNIIKSEFKIK